MRAAIIPALMLAAAPALGQIDVNKALLLYELQNKTANCYRDAALALDDNRSDAATIGRIASQRCRSHELEELTRVTDASEELARQMHSMRGTVYIDRATEIVLERRASKR